MKLITDALARSVDSVSHDGELYYTLRQLYYETDRTLRPHFLTRLGKRFPFASSKVLPYGRYLREVESYMAASGPPPGLLPDEHTPLPPFPAPEPDLAWYGIPRLLICQDDHIARMLTANHVHMELGTAVLGLSEATPLPDSVCAMLVLARGASVFVLHDAGNEGTALIRSLPDRIGLPAGLPVTSIGLRPDQCLAMRVCSTRSRVKRNTLSAYLTECSSTERTRPAGGRIWEISAVRPIDLLRMLSREFRAAGDGP